jgi:hypothetical protein
VQSAVNLYSRWGRAPHLFASANAISGATPDTSPAKAWRSGIVEEGDRPLDVWTEGEELLFIWKSLHYIIAPAESCPRWSLG